MKECKQYDNPEIIKRDYIHKAKIKAKIEEIEKEQQENQKKLDRALCLFSKPEIEKQTNKIIENMNIRDILESLLEEE